MPVTPGSPEKWYSQAECCSTAGPTSVFTGTVLIVYFDGGEPGSILAVAVAKSAAVSIEQASTEPRLAERATSDALVCEVALAERAVVGAAAADTDELSDFELEVPLLPHPPTAKVAAAVTAKSANLGETALAPVRFADIAAS
ncbi:MAG: hypothetical protein JWL70_293 [Acidimicrobiia bacterium]|nr:hypothetical protein [Acidimicrobiia bacterium]